MNYRKPMDGEVIASFSRRTVIWNIVSAVLFSLVLIFLTYSAIRISRNITYFEIERDDLPDYQSYRDSNNFFGLQVEFEDELEYNKFINSKEASEGLFKINHGLVSLLIRLLLELLVIYFLIYKGAIKLLSRYWVEVYVQPNSIRHIVFKIEKGFETIYGDHFKLIYDEDIILLGGNRIKIGSYYYDISDPFNSDMVAFVEFLREQVSFDLMTAALKE